jgi:GR25 family glycosyltransferase involved in LPS biosynthesis
MDAVYINLAHSTRRNATFLDNYRACNISDRWRLHRFEAISADSPQVRNLAGRITDGNKGNYLSHMACIERSLASDDHLFIFEDDARLGAMTEYWVERTIATLDPEEWDILMTDMCVTHSSAMPTFLGHKRQYRTKGILQLLHLQGWDGAFAGASAYVVNRRSKQKLLATLTMDELVQPFDMMLRFVAISGRLSVVLTAPFVTTVDKVADASDTAFGLERRDLAQRILWNQFRRLVWIEGEPDDALLEDIGRVAAGVTIDPDVRALTALINPLLSLQLSW